MRTVSFFSGGLLACVVVAGGCSDWVPIVFEPGGFRAEFPPQYSSLMNDVNTADGTVTVYVFAHDTPGRSLKITYSDYPPAVFEEKSLDAMLEEVRRGVVDLVEGTLLSEEGIEVDGHPGRALRIETGEEPPILQVRFIVAQPRVYQLHARTTRALADSKEIRKFFRSFRIVSAP